MHKFYSRLHITREEVGSGMEAPVWKYYESSHYSMKAIRLTPSDPLGLV
jgi:hypothetical protein